MEDNPELFSCLRVYLYDCDERPALILERVKSKNGKQIQWIPQTICDQVWVIYQFQTEKDKLDWEKLLPKQVSNWIDKNLLSISKKYWAN